MATFIALVTLSIAQVVGASSKLMRDGSNAQIMRDGTIAYAGSGNAHENDMKPVLRNFIQTLPKPQLSLTASASQRFPGAFRALADLDVAYQGHASDPFFVKVDMSQAMLTVKAIGEPVKGAVYGEVQPTSFVQLLDSINATSGMRYYDLGSGIGKTVVMAALLGFNATGVELVHQRWKESCLALGRARHRGLLHNKSSGADASFFKASMMDIDFADADIVFANSVLFTKEMLDAISKHAEFMKPGAKIVSTAGLQGPFIKDVMTFSAPTSWSDKSRWKVQEVVRPSSSSSLADTGKDKGKALGGNPSHSCSLSHPKDTAAMFDEESASLRARLAASLTSTLGYVVNLLR